MTRSLLRHLANETGKLRQAGLYKAEVAPPTPDADPATAPISFTTGDYIGLGQRPEVTEAAIAAIQAHGHGRPAPRPFGGTLALHHDLEAQLAGFIDMPEAIVYGSGYLANVGLFDALFDARDYVLVDAAIHPSVAEGIRLCGARTLAYRSEDLESLEDRLKRSRTARFRLVVTDGVFPLSGNVAPLRDVCDLADRYDALVVVHDALGVGVLGERQAGSLDLAGVAPRVHAVTGGFVDVLGGGGGGYVAGRKEIVDWLRQKSTPYLFSGPLPPADVGAASAALTLVTRTQAPASAVLANTRALKEALSARGFEVHGGEHPILTVIVGDAVTLQRMVNALSEEGVHVQGMCYPVVPENAARIQLKINTAHSEPVLDSAVERLVQAAHTLRLL